MQTISEQLRAKRNPNPAAALAPYVVYVDDVAHGFQSRTVAAAYATGALYAPHVNRIETNHLQLSRDGSRFI